MLSVRKRKISKEPLNSFCFFLNFYCIACLIEIFVFFLFVYLYENRFFFHKKCSDQFALAPLLPALPILPFSSLLYPLPLCILHKRAALQETTKQDKTKCNKTKSSLFKAGQRYPASPTSSLPPLLQHVFQAGQIIGQRFCDWIDVQASLLVPAE